MKNIILSFFALISSLGCFAQEKKAVSWFGEFHTGYQATLNAYPLAAQIKSGFENKPFDSTIHYSTFFKDQFPVQAVMGLNNNKGLQLQLSAAYYQMTMALRNPQGAPENESYLFGRSHIVTFRIHSLLEYHSILGRSKNNKLHFFSGISAGASVPVNLRLNDATANHFGIQSFNRNISWNLGLDFMLNFDISKRFYIANTLAAIIPITGSLGSLQMQCNSNYSAGAAIKITSLSLSTGVGLRF